MCFPFEEGGLGFKLTNDKLRTKTVEHKIPFAGLMSKMHINKNGTSRTETNPTDFCHNTHKYEWGEIFGVLF